MHEIHMPAKGIDLRATLIDSAQCFLWRETEAGFAAAMDDGRGVSAFLASLRGGELIVACERPPEERFWRAYFDQDTDYERLAERYAGNERAAAALRAARGLRVLRQPAWDALVSFILSANNNVRRITQLVARLSGRFGEAATIGRETCRAIPAPEALASAAEEELRALGCGYRAPYLIETARLVAAGQPLEALRDEPYERAHAALKAFKGVGDKVADCVCLFGLHHTRAFPVDVWVERLMRQWYGMEGMSRRQISEAAIEMFGDDAGLVQQYLFHCARLGLIGVLSK